jgi:hypothetical protein
VSSDNALVTQVAEAGNLTDVIAVLWTWLETRRSILGSLGVSEAALRVSAADGPKFTGIVTADDLDALRASPVTAAAELLVRISNRAEAQHLASWAWPATGYDGAEVVVLWKRADLAIKAAGGPKASLKNASPPSAMEHPSLEALVPRLAVRSVECAGLRLVVDQPA